MATTMDIIPSQSSIPQALTNMLEGYDHPAILVSPKYEIMAINSHYKAQFGSLALHGTQYCYQVSHGYSVPCDQAGEDCPLAAAQASGHKERALHIHQTPRGKEHVDVEMLPILDEQGHLLCFVELLRAIPSIGDKDSKQTMVGTSTAFNKMLSQILRVNNSEASVLLLGESGTGKELAASSIHCGSRRKEAALVTLECSGLSDALFESELFGHIKGAFTGAYSNKKGLVELADGGTLFLDEIGDVPLSMQVKLLRLLESGTYRPVGSPQVKHTNFRLICATHKNIQKMLDTGAFRQDLYYRINVFPIKIPPLRERIEDIPILVKTLLKQLSPSKDFFFTETALRRLKRYTFPGNIRELRNLLNRAIVLTDTNLIEEVIIKQSLEIDSNQEHLEIKEKPIHATGPWVDLKTAERTYLQKLLLSLNGDKKRAAAIAGISTRSLYRKLES